MHAVVFTHVAVTHLAIVEMLRADAFHVYEFSGATKITERHQSIRDFQTGVGAGRPSLGRPRSS